MNTPDVFKRVEYKYLLSPQQFDSLTESLADKIRPDEFGRSTVSSLYYDTRQFAMINRSLEKPVYKEKLRIRAYGTPEDGDPVYVEREAYRCISAPDLRITFDIMPRWRTDDLFFSAEQAGHLLYPDDKMIMEIKCTDAYPFWLIEELDKHGVYPQPNSKYGLSYQEHHHLSCALASLVLGVVIALVYMFRHEYSKNFVVTLALLHSNGKHPASLPAGQAAARRAGHRGRYSKRGGSPVSMMWTSAASSRTGTPSSCAFASLLPAPGPATT